MVTNIDEEHLESYRDFDGLVEAFGRFAESVPAEARRSLCTDDPHVTAAEPDHRGARSSYGARRSPGGDRRDWTWREEGFGTSATVVRRHDGHEQVLGELALQVPGRHNVLNALAATSVALELGVRLRHRRALGEFRGAERRFERKGEVRADARGRRLRPSPDRESRRCCARRAPRAPKRSCACFSRTGTRGPRGCSTDSDRRCRSPTRSC